MKYEIGEIVEGKITGIQAYGAFVALDDDTNGLIHISEISDGYVKDITRFVRVGDTVRVKIIDIDESTNQVRLSLKALHKKRAHGRMGMFSHKATLPESKLGFLSIEKQLPIWIQEAKKGDRR
ncbi:MAG: CvfD/Ygs/GSP13 family RNA-binding post-transcriptional regulator [Bulleidia sp.]|nr:CvfD/Ygs/GSP13 family RNA-binding post-transcriptional regulator [Erysipelotrichaceae bacterium]MDY2781592.1 CvfD/Ygs/GSP13 family RNA-binding post-transcriptional regulator [Bulleidia sp.]